jgi:hypothetical protein
MHSHFASGGPPGANFLKKVGQKLFIRFWLKLKNSITFFSLVMVKYIFVI